MRLSAPKSQVGHRRSARRKAAGPQDAGLSGGRKAVTNAFAAA
jgi:hypothetical protein